MKGKKQSEENTELVKEKDNPKRNYIFKKNGATKTGFTVILIILIIVAIGVLLSGLVLETSFSF
ncbi:hypothetical protein K1F50_03315 [Muricauda oceani]|uniref:Uncharacterized protein n=1 Tax=Flagellimonas oceani TaxID=2698672 RepID=A0A6G7J8I2_9FLAO|nr:hypothetical protein [Allomuricauda oceani]MBW8241815.1 hypothetical protein [Allomuricauda oceani]QII46737.1 hypothetical protein GVT53_19305 [Allomuricauda oceani]